MEATVDEPDFTTARRPGPGIREKVSEFTTYFPYAEYRNINIGRAAELVDGTLLKPGETFSLNGIVGERTRENGFTEGFVISDGIFKEDLGGGVSQMATTTFNAMFFAGLRTSSTSRTRSTSTATRSAARPPWPGRSVDLRSATTPTYGVLITAGSPRARRRRRAR